VRVLWLVRHARPLVAPGLCYGVTDLPADPTATQDAAAAAAAALPKGLGVRVSGLRRAQQLAAALAELRPDLGPATTDPRLNEMDFGAWEMTPWSLIPREAVDRWTADFPAHRFGGAESAQEVVDRVAEVLGTCVPREGAIWITHAGVIRACQWSCSTGGARLRTASDWPAAAPLPGAWLCLPIPLDRAR